MSEPQGGSKSSGVGGWENRPPQWWLPVLTFLMSITLGICCLFFMSIGGITLCIIHCVIGALLAAIAFWGFISQSKVVLLVAAFLNFLGMLLLFCTFVYAAWQLAQNGKAKHEADTETYSPIIEPLLLHYFLHARREARHLSAVEEGLEVGMSPLPHPPAPFAGGLGFGDSLAGGEGESALEPADWEAEQEAAAAFSPSFLERDLANQGEGGGASPGPSGSPEAADQEGREDATGVESALAELQLYGVKPQGPGGKFASRSFAGGHPANALELLGAVEGGQPADETTLQPAGVRQSQVPGEVGGYVLSESEQKCLEKAATDMEFAEKMTDTASSLLDRGLFCGYSRYNVGVFKKWPLSCEAECYFDGLYFTIHRDSEEKTIEKIQKFAADVGSMDPATSRVCFVLLQVTACKIEEHHYLSGVIAAMALGVVLCVVIGVLEVMICLNCFNIVKKNHEAGLGGAQVVPQADGA